MTVCLLYPGCKKDKIDGLVEIIRDVDKKFSLEIHMVEIGQEIELLLTKRLRDLLVSFASEL